MKIHTQSNSRHIQTIVIGGGQAGLSVGYHLAKRGISFLILDANQRIGDAWRNRWDSLRLFTTARYCGLPGLPFPARGDAFPTKEEMADYLESYAANLHLRVQTGVKVDRLAKEGDRFVVTAGALRFEAENVVVAMANYQIPRRPEFRKGSRFRYRSTAFPRISQSLATAGWGSLIVGVGNSGADIAMEVSRTHRPGYLGKESGHIPWPIEGFMGRFFFIRLLRFAGHHVLNLSTPIGRKLRPKMLSRAAPLVRVKPKDLINAGIERVPRVVGVRDGQPLLSDDRTLDVKNVIWCTGYHPGFSWIDLPIFGGDGKPIHERGIVDRVPGLYFVGLHFLYSMTSATVTGVGRDAERVANTIERRTLASKSQGAWCLRSAEAV